MDFTNILIFVVIGVVVFIIYRIVDKKMGP